MVTSRFLSYQTLVLQVFGNRGNVIYFMIFVFETKVSST